MNRPAFLSIIPKPIQVSALVIVLLAVSIAVGLGISYAATGNAVLWSHTHGLILIAGGLFLPAWLLGFGYVYADARRRAMRPVLWVFIALLVPHLLGFLLYFVLRQPIAVACPHCGNTIPSGQRFCSWCGTPQTLAVPPPGTSTVQL